MCIQYNMRLSLYLPLLSEGPGIPFVGIELNCGLTSRDEIDLPSSQDGQCYCDSKTDKEGDDYQGSFRV